MKALIPKSDFKNELPDGRAIHFKQKMVYIVPDSIDQILNIMFVRQGLKPEKFFNSMDARSLIRPYDDTEDNTHNTPVIVRSGGIGDLIALSSLTWYLHDKTQHGIIFISDERFHDVFKWFWYPPIIVLDHFDPLCYHSPLNINVKYLRLISLEYICEDNPRKNWYEKFYERINAPFLPHYGKPYLTNVYSELFPEMQNRIIIINKASSHMRSIHIGTILKALSLSDLRNDRISVFEQNLSDVDYRFLSPEIFIEPTNNVEDFLYTLSKYSKIISVDTAGIHFFEGIERQGLGLYSSFTTESRTKYYNYTKSIDIQSSCELQPCFLHDKKAGDLCPKMSPGETTAPCMGRLSKDIIEQLTDNMNQWKKTF